MPVAEQAGLNVTQSQTFKDTFSLDGAQVMLDGAQVMLETGTVDNP